MASKARLLFLLFGLLAGAGIGSLVTYRYCNGPSEPKHEVRMAPPFLDPEPEMMLWPPDVTLENLIPDPELREAMLNPDTVKVHPEGGTLKIGDWSFAAEGGTPDAETLARLKHALGSLSSWEPTGKMCIFHADILLRLEKNGRTHDIIFCFGCGETTAGVDMTEQGKRTFFKCFCDTIPDSAWLQEKRLDFEKRH